MIYYNYVAKRYEFLKEGETRKDRPRRYDNNSRTSQG
jgi:hypothetical protein